MRYLNIIIFLLVLAAGCSPEKAPLTDAGAQIRFSADTLYFDSVFAGTGSITLGLKIFNPNSRPLLLSGVSLMGGSASPFRINADGTPGPVITSLQIPAQDSIYLFATVQPLSNGSNGVFLAADSVQIAYNGQRRFLQLRAEVRNAYFLRQPQIDTDTLWTSDRPIVITRPLTIAAGRTLRIQPGTRVYAAAGAPLLIQGRMEALGTNSGGGQIRFAGDRLDEPYKSFPAGWPGMVFGAQSSGSAFRFVRISNAYQAMVLAGPGAGGAPKLQMDQCIVDNIYDAAITGLASTLTANNCLILNAGQNLVLRGGTYQFTHCTIATYQSLYIDHSFPVVQLSTRINGQQSSPLQATFTNCILWGSGGRAENEISAAPEAGFAISAQFTNCLYRMKDSNPAGTVFTASLRNQDPLFDSINTTLNRYILKLRPGSPCINAGAVTGLNSDIDGKIRTNLPDIGCYEF